MGVANKGHGLQKVEASCSPPKVCGCLLSLSLWSSIDIDIQSWVVLYSQNCFHKNIYWGVDVLPLTNICVPFGKFCNIVPLGTFCNVFVQFGKLQIF